MNPLLFEPRHFFPQCHACCLLALPDGRKLCAYFAGTHEKHDDVGIWLSEYNGRKWLVPRKIAKIANEPHWNPVLFPVRDGIRMVFKVGKEIRAWKSYTMLSKDGGSTWEGLHGYIDNPAGGPVRSKPIRLKSGALLAPNSDENGPWLPRVDISFDEGETFQRYGEIPVNLTAPGTQDYIPGRGAIQPVLWESEEGHVHAFLRTSGGFIYRSDSVDGGKTWCRAYPTKMANNNSGVDAIMGEDGRLYLICNPVQGDWAARTPLSIFVSDDQGESFRPCAVVDDTPLDEETGKAAELSYPSLVLGGGKLQVAYTFNRRSIAYWEQKIK